MKIVENVLLVGPIPPPAGGVASSMVALASALRRRGATVTVVDPERSKTRTVAAVAAASARRAVIHLHVCGHNRPSYYLLAAVRALAGPSPMIVTLHSGILVQYLDGLSATERRFVRMLLAIVDRVVCVSASNAEAVVALGLPRARVEVASPFIAEAVEGPRREARAQGDDVVLSLMAAPGPLYGLDLVAEAFPVIAAAAPARLLVFGTGGADGELASALATRGLGDRVSALGELSHPSVLEVLRSSDIFLRPTRADGDSMSVREALAVGCRVVASDAAVRPPGTITFPVGDARLLAAAVARALDEPSRAAGGDDGLSTLVSLYQELGWQPSPLAPATPATSSPAGSMSGAGRCEL